MNKRIFSAIVSIAMTATMFPMTVFAEDEVQKSGGGEFEGQVTIAGIVDKDIYCVELPTSVSTDFSFIIDPQQLITKTAATPAASTSPDGAYAVGGGDVVIHAKYDGAEFEPGKTMYFKSFNATATSGSKDEYTSKSKTLTVTNKSSKAVNANVDFVISGIEGITFASDDTFTISGTDSGGSPTTTPITTPSMYLKASVTPYLLTNSPAGSGVSAGSAVDKVFTLDESDPNKASASFSGDDNIKLTQSNYDAYMYKYTAASPTANPPIKEKYEFVPDPSKTSYAFERFEITLEGAVNDVVGWFDLVGGDSSGFATGFTPKIDIVFDITLDGYENTGTGDPDSPSSNTSLSKNSISSADVIEILNDKQISMLEWTRANDGVVVNLTELSAQQQSNFYTLSGTSLTITSVAFDNGTQLKVTFSDGSSEVVTFTK